MWIPISARLPGLRECVQVRYETERGVRSTVGFVDYPNISDGNIPISELPLDWFSPLWRDHKGRNEELSKVTHWAPLLDPNAAAETPQSVAAHVITILVLENGAVEGDLDDAVSLWPICATEGEATTIDGQARSLLDQALRRILVGDLDPERLPSPEPQGESQ